MSRNQWVVNDELCVVGVICARGGSKGVPHKNIRPLAGKSLIAYTIETALASALIDRIIVSTDDVNIADVAGKYGANVPFLRPAELARDDTPVIDSVLHAMRWLDEHEGYRPDYVMLLQPTSPLRSTEDIDGAVQLAREKQADSVVSVYSVHQHPYWMKRVTKDGRLVDFLSLDRTYTCRQDLPSVYALNGAIYLARREILLERQTFYTNQTCAYVMPPERSLDIDTLWDFYMTELILKDRLHHERD
jgi:N-acylneuraminate cytidylyltransferase/CMP-N,N'-diacetyllegionaminic acid synthase